MIHESKIWRNNESIGIRRMVFSHTVECRNQNGSPGIVDLCQRFNIFCKLHPTAIRLDLTIISYGHLTNDACINNSDIRISRFRALSFKSYQPIEIEVLDNLFSMTNSIHTLHPIISKPTLKIS
jgi:hypothetical protein